MTAKLQDAEQQMEAAQGRASQLEKVKNRLQGELEDSMVEVDKVGTRSGRESWSERQEQTPERPDCRGGQGLCRHRFAIPSRIWLMGGRHNNQTFDTGSYPNLDCRTDET